MNKTLVRAATVFFISICFTSIAAAEKLQIGFIVPLSGPAATWGNEIRDAARLSLEDVSSELKDRIELVFEDDQFQPKQTVSAFHKLSSSPDTKFIVTFGGVTSSAIAPIADSHGVPVVAITGAASVARDRQFVVRHWVSAAVQAEVIGNELSAKGIKRIAVVLTEDEPPREFADALRSHARRSGIDILAEEAVLPADRDFRSLCSKLATLPLDAVVTAMLPGHLGLFSKQLRSLGANMPIYGFSGSESRGEVETAAGALEGLIYANSAPTEQFVERYRKKYSRDPEGAAANAYDAVQIMSSAFQERCCERKALNDYIHGQRLISGALGKYNIGSDNAFIIPAQLKIIDKSRFRRLSEVTAGRSGR